MIQNEDEIIIATYNIQFARNIEKILTNLETMIKEEVTIFCLQEIINIPNEKLIVKKILERLGNHWRASYHMGTEDLRLSIGTCIIWDTNKVQLKQEKKILLPKLMGLAGREVIYYKLLGIPPIPLQRRTISCLFTFNKRLFRVTCVHLDNIGGVNHRLKQVKYILSSLRTMQEPDSEIICGDFNTIDIWQTGREKKQLQNVLGNEFNDASKNIGWTEDPFYSDFQGNNRFIPQVFKKLNFHIRKKLDYLWVNNLVIISCKKLLLSGSDHLPVIAKVKLK